MSELAFAVAVFGMVAVVAIVFGRGFKWKTGRNGCEIDVAENGARKEKEAQDPDGKKDR